jgi:1-acyl-sn-glycerol-3-phosphate acyltransferase
MTIAIVGFLLAYLLCIPFYLLGRLFRPFEKAGDVIMQKGIAFLMLIQPWYKANVKISLPSHKNTQGILLVSNHRSTLDVFILLSQVQGIRIMAKSTLFKIPFLNLVMWASRQISVPRGRLDAFFKAMENIRARLRQGEVVHVFPEMTRCQQGFQGLQSFSAAPFSSALQEKSMVLPIVFMGTDDAWPKGFFGLFFRRPITVTSLQPIDLKQVHFASAEQLKNEVHQRIAAAL